MINEIFKLSALIESCPPEKRAQLLNEVSLAILQDYKLFTKINRLEKKIYKLSKNQ